MIWLGMGVLLLSILFGGPALAALIRHQSARRAAAAAARQAEEEERQQRALEAQQQVDLLWRNSPDRAGVGEFLRFIAMRARLDHVANETRRRLEQLSALVDHYLSRYPQGRLPSARYRLVVMTGVVLFLGVFGLAITLDFLIFRGLHPTGSVVLPFSLACLAVVGITVGSVVMFGARRHDLLPEGISHYYRQVIVLGGGLLALCVAGYMMVIAPYRSYPAGEAAIIKAEQVLQADQSAVPPASSQLIQVDTTAVSQAQANLAHAQAVDRLSAGALALVEIPLSEAAVLGGELLVLYLAIARRERARQVHQQAEDEVEHANARFIAELTQILINHGHNEESVRRIIDRVSAMNAAPNGRPVLVGGGPAVSGQPGAPGPFGPGNPVAHASGQIGLPAPAGGPGIPGAPQGGPVPGGPTVTTIPPNPPGTSNPPGGPGAPGAPAEMAAIVQLPGAENDLTE
jgi:hypothetical protein